MSMKIQKHSAFLRRHPVFTSRDLDKHLAARGGFGPRTDEAFLTYYRRVGRLARIRRGLYATVPPGADPRTQPVNPYLIAARLTPDAVLSHHTALEYHGRAHSVWQHFFYSAARPARPVTFRSHLFRGVRFPRALLHCGHEFQAALETEEQGLTIRVTSLERTLVDVLHRPDLSGGWEEVWRSLESVEFFDLDVVVEYALLLHNATTAAKVGFFLERHRAELMVDDCHLERLRRHRPRQPHHMDRMRHRPARLVRDWNLMVPEEVLERSWEEVP